MKKIGRYDIISELGRGAMGVVYRASDPTIGREVALKVLTLSASPGEGTNSPQEMFMREIRAAGRLTHPSIVAIHDAFDDPENQTSCIVMEMVPGVTLEKILDSDPPPTVEEALDIVRQVADGLDYAHRNQVIHRDLKPANILVTMDGRAKITGFIQCSRERNLSPAILRR
jgi:serine/threonine-protein kinase